jgi:DNA topoisomerase-3
MEAEAKRVGEEIGLAWIRPIASNYAHNAAHGLYRAILRQPELTEEQFIGEAKTEDGKSYKIYATEKAYHVPEIVTKKDPHGIRIGKSILQCEIPQDQLLKLIGTGKTDVLKGFVSNRTKRKFDAHLTFDPKDGKIGFDFPPRPVKKVAAKKVAKAKEA